MKIIGIVGWKNSGKTRLAKEIIKYLVSKDFVIGTIKHAHHSFDIDKKETDSFIHRKAGAQEVLISSSKRWAKIDEREKLNELSLNDLLKKIERADIVLVEGFKKESHKKIEVMRGIDSKKKPLYNILSNVVAIVSNYKVNAKVPVFKENDFKGIGNFIISLDS